MIRLLLLLAILFAVVFGFTWLKSTPGEVAMTVGDTAYAVDLTTGIIALAVVILLGMTVVWLVRELIAAPWRVARGFRRRSHERGRAAQSQGLIAIAAGDVRIAERAMQDAARRLPDQPLTKLLKAQTAQLKGDRATARRIFQEMTEDSATRTVGLRGLYIEAERQGEHIAAHQIAERARGEAPTAPWAARALLRHQTAAADWDGALATLTGAVDARIIDKRTARRQRAVILTAKALAKEDGEPNVARAAALEAHDLAVDLVPAAAAAGRLLARNGDIRRATRVLEATWKAGPHPEIAEAYLHVRSGDSATDRLKRAETLARMRPHADEGRRAVTRAAIDARDFARAREALTPIVTERPTQQALILMGELEEAESGDRGRARGWLARAVYAPRDPAWTADGIVLEEWAPISPVSGQLDAVEWKVPLAELEGPKLEIDAAELTPLPPAKAAKDDDDAEDGKTPADEVAKPKDAAATVVTVSPSNALPRSDKSTEPTDAGAAASRERAAARKGDAVASGGTAAIIGTAESKGQAAAAPSEAYTARSAASDPTAEPPRPDDPGVGDDNEEEESARALPDFLTRNSAEAGRRV